MARNVRRTICIAVGLAALSTAGAGAETRTFVFDTPLYPVGGAGNVGPANQYPARIPVSGVSGTVTKATVELFGYTSAAPDNNDLVLVGPNGAKVMLMSDACGPYPTTSVTAANFVVDDAAPTFLSKPGPCPSFARSTFKPSNYLGNAPEPDDLSPDGGPTPPYTNSLSAFAGSTPNGNWDLFVRDDDEAIFGFTIPAWALTLEINPPAGTPAPPPTIPSNEFTILGRDGRKLRVEVASAGEVTVADAGNGRPKLKATSATGGPGTVAVKLKPTRTAKRKLKRAGKVKVAAEVTFAPSGGSAASQTKRLKLRR